MAVHLVTGDDESLLRTQAHELVKQLVGAGDRSLMVDEFDGEEYEVREVADAAQTMPFLTDKRVVVARGVGRFSAEEVVPLVLYLGNPLDTTDLVLVGGGGRLAKKLTDAVVGAGGHKVDASPPARPKDRVAWVRTRAEEHGVRLDGPAAARVADQLGEDAGRLDGLLKVLTSTYGDNVRLTGQDIEPFLGEGGGVPPWDLTDALDAGRTADAITLMRRMVHGGQRHPLQIMAILHGHYTRLAKLDGVNARTEAEAAAAIGIKPGYPAKKALETYGRLGGGAVAKSVQLMAKADRDLHGDTALEAEAVMEILIARLSKLSPRR
ncbi:MAG TPA: DNA polymerase III subunit delta [Ilumatobacter sp.]|nr:DNA polymerase III subunit delta [Ilumatobacter sp.]